jgi:RNA polymerase sigma-70 factor (ECF subfamily)
MEDNAPGPLEAAIGRQTLDRYEAALAQLKPEERDAIVSRLEFGMTYAEVATALEKPTADAARMMVVRALERLADEMAEQRDDQRGTNKEPGSNN